MSKPSIKQQAEAVEVVAQGHRNQTEDRRDKYLPQLLAVRDDRQIALDAAVTTLKWLVLKEAEIKAALKKDAA
ncbi:hypothetical protein ACT6QG_05410 [Xanthobacter sp. TB0136]|uniref:hypothetical protein n=1 Tax=Xanthobacter sp. TB0136 TaxID=3459177 RepID=UPI00403981D0